MEISDQINEAKKQKPIQIFSKGHKEIGVNVIKSPVKLVILSMLKDSEMEFDEIVKNTGKSKSTVSVHLKSLRKDGVISFKFDPEDQRKKIFYINSRFLGEIEVPEPFELKEQKTEFLIENIINKKDSDKFDFSRLLFHTFRSTLIQEGININPLLYEAGYHIGLALYEELKDDDVDTFLKNVQEFWEDYGLGRIEFDLGEKIKITSYDCFECELLPKTGKPACYLDGGIIEAILSSFLKKDLKVTETHCFTMGDNRCVFEVETLE
ncbi:ArsR family transcriptional regulator [Methanobrevibacter sp. TMH8]|uniref:V4R domain-containing protein n=1 Tax=Methanobrevibacter sp. TMH8 TaxID=2848611 RepID=UPI001CCABE48|nr:V4R domain-containing protein [Methanobrevibacter sp. TMH8]MBZ9570075.1 ArsR family transcriptional regulator [Methanobrevibacter sp. TMH8]